MPAQTSFGVIDKYLSIKDQIHAGMYPFQDEIEMKQEAVEPTEEEEDYLMRRHNNSISRFLDLDDEPWFDSYVNVTLPHNPAPVAGSKGAPAGKSFALSAQGAGCTVIESSGRLGEGELSGGESSPNLFDLDKQSFYSDDHNTSSSSFSSSSSGSFSNDIPKPRIKLEQADPGFGGDGCLTQPTDDMMQTLSAVDEVFEIARKLGIPVNPNKWSHMDTQTWVQYTLNCNSYDEDCGALFSVEGEVLCQMRLSDFSWRSSQAGGFLYQSLDIWKLVSQMVPPTPVKDQTSPPVFTAHVNNKTANNSLITTTTTTIGDNRNSMLHHAPTIPISAASSASALNGFATELPPHQQDKMSVWLGGSDSMVAPAYALPPSVSPSPSMTDSTSSADAFVVPVSSGMLTDDDMVLYSPDHHGQQTKRPLSTNTPHHPINTNVQARHNVSGGLTHRTGGSGSRLGKQTIHLWQFLRELLDDPENCRNIIKWVDRTKGVFKIEDSTKVAKLWGRRKNRPAMNYDKLSRSVRQYYKKGIIKKTEMSKRLVYQFCQPYL